jgi:hypothetical protein
LPRTAAQGPLALLPSVRQQAFAAKAEFVFLRFVVEIEGLNVGVVVR